MATINYSKPAADCIVLADGRTAEEARIANGPNQAGREPRMPFDYDPEKEYETDDYRGNLTLDELAENDKEMAKYAIKGAKAYYFDLKFIEDPITGHPLPDTRIPMMFIGRCIQITLNRCGLMILEGMKAKLVQRKMDKNKIQIENRGDKYFGDDAWRNGMYIFKAGELVAFISQPMIEIPSRFALNQTKRWVVRTNAKIDLKGFR